MRCVNGDKQIKSQVKNTIIKNGKEFRDLNGNGIVAPYENWELPIEEWVQGLLSRMTLEENHPFPNRVLQQYWQHSDLNIKHSSMCSVADAIHQGSCRSHCRQVRRFSTKRVPETFRGMPRKTTMFIRTARGMNMGSVTEIPINRREVLKNES